MEFPCSCNAVELLYHLNNDSHWLVCFKTASLSSLGWPTTHRVLSLEIASLMLRLKLCVTTPSSFFVFLKTDSPTVIRCKATGFSS